jgi:SAM-dependent methyltransferase
MRDLDRERPSCEQCGSSPRFRAIVSILSEQLLGASLCLPDFPVRKDLVGIGLSDWDGYADLLSERFSYTNTYYHREPRLDIVNPPASLEGTLDFLISTEVFEHVPPPVSRAFQAVRRLLKPTGLLVFTVPYGNTPGLQTVEHFPDLFDFEIRDVGGRKQVINRTRTGEIQTFDDLVFHGGGGLELEMRVFSEAGLREELRAAGFNTVQLWQARDWEHGVFWPEPWSHPIFARPL